MYEYFFNCYCQIVWGNKQNNTRNIFKIFVMCFHEWMKNVSVKKEKVMYVMHKTMYKNQRTIIQFYLIDKCTNNIKLNNK